MDAMQDKFHPEPKLYMMQGDAKQARCLHSIEIIRIELFGRKRLNVDDVVISISCMNGQTLAYFVPRVPV